MKTTKKIFAAFIAVMMIALMIPFSASAASEYSANLTGKAGYTVSVYKVADLDTTTGKYTSSITAIQDELNKVEGADNKNVLKACDAAAVSSAVETKTFTDGDTTFNFTTDEAGVYYFKWTGTPAGVDSKIISNSVISLPYYKEGKEGKDSNWVNSYTGTISAKVEDSTPAVSKKIENSDIDDSNTTAAIGSDVTFTLTADKVGSSTEKAKMYKLTDTMSAGLTYKEVKEVKVGTTVVSAADYTVTQNGQTVDIEFTSSYLNNGDSAFYKADKVYVTYVATVNTAALISIAGELKPNTNHVDLHYTNNMNVDSDITGNTVNVYTFTLNVGKVDGNTKAPLPNATFKLTSKNDAEFVKTLTTGTDGSVTFTGLKAGTYYVEETVAPEGYNINSKKFEITISTQGIVTGDNVKDNKLVVSDFPLSVPQTGGAGTVMFTVGGIALIACAGVLFFVVMRKKKTSK
ncbi:SpaH/EbpB family LPXTG-anchored major pilin [Ruminococcus intestinalis]|uniref:SpaH/EbpB family LPXTG-anchored major pilin n=1 Tax=Ruminococcus intestinalis TaxID=2763066 RepID=UPI003F819983